MEKLETNHQKRLAYLEKKQEESFEKIRKNFRATFACADTIREARRSAAIRVIRCQEPIVKKDLSQSETKQAE
jgi:hypothetical protein